MLRLVRKNSDPTDPLVLARVLKAPESEAIEVALGADLDRSEEVCLLAEEVLYAAPMDISGWLVIAGPTHCRSPFWRSSLGLTRTTMNRSPSTTTFAASTIGRC